MKLDLWTFDVGVEATSPDAYAEACLGRVETSWAEGADVVVFPEFCWLGLERFSGRNQELRGVSDLFWTELFPKALPRLTRNGKTAVLGTAPFWDEQSGRILNRAPIICEGQVLHQDKLHLTPWENTLSPGDEIRLWRFGGLTFAVLICLDIEVPELATQIRGWGVDVILVPSATETLLGVERVDRCASARAVELGCCVGVAHLTGEAESELIDENMGRTAFYTPSQAAWAGVTRINENPVIDSGFQCLRCELDPQIFAEMRAATSETNPSRLSARSPLKITLF